MSAAFWIAIAVALVVAAIAISAVIVGHDADTDTSAEQGPVTPPVDPNDPETEWHVV